MFPYILVLVVLMEMGEKAPEFVAPFARADFCIAKAAEMNNAKKAELDAQRGQMYLCLQILYPT